MLQDIWRDQQPRTVQPRIARARLCLPVIICVVTTVLTFFNSLAEAEYAQTAETLSQVKKVYVGSLGDKQGATALRDKLIRRLRKSHNIEVAASAAEADAVITGNGEIWVKGYISTNPKPSPYNRQAVYGGYLSVELKGKDNEILWSSRTTPGKLLWDDITQDLANQQVKKLLAALKHSHGTGHSV